VAVTAIAAFRQLRHYRNASDIVVYCGSSTGWIPPESLARAAISAMLRLRGVKGVDAGVFMSMQQDESKRDGDADRLDPTARVLERVAIAIVLPMWSAAGSLDYVLHRRSHIERTSGSYESRLHACGIAAAAVPVLTGLFLEIDAGVVAIMTAGFVGHVAMTVWDVSYADERRRIVPLEQHVHGLLELLPLTALSLVTIAHREQTLALVRLGDASPRFRLRLKRRPIPSSPLIALILTFTVTVALPYAEELIRCHRYEHGERPAPPD